MSKFFQASLALVICTISTVCVAGSPLANLGFDVDGTDVDAQFHFFKDSAFKADLRWDLNDNCWTDFGGTKSYLRSAKDQLDVGTSCRYKLGGFTLKLSVDQYFYRGRDDMRSAVVDLKHDWFRVSYTEFVREDRSDGSELEFSTDFKYRDWLTFSPYMSLEKGFGKEDRLTLKFKSQANLTEHLTLSVKGSTDPRKTDYFIGLKYEREFDIFWLLTPRR